MTDVITRADDRWARMTLLLWSHCEEERRQLMKPNRSAGAPETSTCTHPSGFSTEVSQSLRQVGKLFAVPAASRDRETRLLEGGKAAARESPGEGEEHGFQSDDNAHRHVRPREQMNDQANHLRGRARQQRAARQQ